MAGVTVIIVGLSNKVDNDSNYLFLNNLKISVDSINAYLIPAKNAIYINSHSKSISNLPIINHGNMPADGGKFLFTPKAKEEFVHNEPHSEKWFKKLIAVKEHLNGQDKWCLWLEGISNDEIEKMPLVKSLVNDVKIIREKSSRPFLAKTPHLFAQITQPEGLNCVIIPRVSSENRKYLPIDFLDGKIYKVTDSYFTVATNEPYIFGIVSSLMHMVWMKSIGGRLETRVQYSKNIVYNSFPFPNINEKQKENINLYVFQVLEEREKYSEKPLAKLYDPIKMPKSLKDAHYELDLAIERCYRLKPFENDTERLEYLFKLYEEMTTKNALLTKQKKLKK